MIKNEPNQNDESQINLSEANHNDQMDSMYHVGLSNENRTHRNESYNGHYEKFDNEQDRKLFIGYGLGLMLNEESIEEFFSEFGTVERVNVKRDAVTSKERGFAFITMASPDDVQKVLNSCPIYIKNKLVDVKMAKSRPISKKVFVGGIDPNLTKEDITDYFKCFGNVIDIELPFDRMKQKRREFCFIIFDTEDSANIAAENPKQTIFGRECDVKKACPQPIANRQKNQGNFQQSFMGQQSDNYFGLNQNSNDMFQNSNQMKNGYRGNYRGRSSSNRNNNGNYFQNGRRSTDSQYNFMYDSNSNYNNNSSFNSSFNGRKSSHLGGNRQYNQNGTHSNYNKNYNNKQSNSSQQLQQTNPQQFYDQLAQQQNYYGYQQSQYSADDYYSAQDFAQNFQQPHSTSPLMGNYAGQT